MTCFIPFTRL